MNTANAIDKKPNACEVTPLRTADPLVVVGKLSGSEAPVTVKSSSTGAGVGRLVGFKVGWALTGGTSTDGAAVGAVDGAAVGKTGHLYSNDWTVFDGMLGP